MKCRLKYFEHVNRMCSERYPKIALHGYVHGKRNKGRPTKRWPYNVKVDCEEMGLNLYEATSRTMLRLTIFYVCETTDARNRSHRPADQNGELTPHHALHHAAVTQYRTSLSKYQSTTRVLQLKYNTCSCTSYGSQRNEKRLRSKASADWSHGRTTRRAFSPPT